MAYLLRTAKTVWAPTLVYLSARLLSCTVYVLRFLGEVEYRPCREEIVSMLLDYLLVLVSAATVYLVARITSRRA